MGEKDVIFNPSITDDVLVPDVEDRPSGSTLHSIAPGVNVMRDAEGDIIGLYDDLGNPILQ